MDKELKGWLNGIAFTLIVEGLIIGVWKVLTWLN